MTLSPPVNPDGDNHVRRLPCFVFTRGLLWICFFKCAYWVALLLAVRFWGNDRLFTSLYWPQATSPTLTSHFIPFDGAYYLLISETGYSAGTRSCAFYPLWPMTIRVVAPVFGGAKLIAGLVLANLFSAAAWIILHRIVERKFGHQIATITIVLLIAFPGSLFYQMLYSESLFLLLLMLMWWGLENENVVLVAGASFALPLTRAIGVFCFAPILWHLITRHSPGGLIPRWAKVLRLSSAPGNGLGVHTGIESTPSGSAVVACGSRRSGWWLVLVPMLGWSLYLLLMNAWTNNPFEGFEAQKYWGVHSVSNLYNISKFMYGLLSPSHWHEFTGSVLDRVVFLMLMYCVPVLWRIDKGFLLWVYVLGILPAMSGTFTSFVRFAALVFPMFVALAVTFGTHERRWMRYGLMGLFGIVHLVLVWRYVNYGWAG